MKIAWYVFGESMFFFAIVNCTAHYHDHVFYRFMLPVLLILGVLGGVEHCRLVDEGRGR